MDLPGYGYAKGPEDERLAWRPLINALKPRASLRGVFPDRRLPPRLAGGGRGPPRLGGAAARIHVLLTKADKLNRSESTKVLRETRTILGDRATAQLFRCRTRLGTRKRREALEMAGMTSGRSVRAGHKKPR